MFCDSCGAALQPGQGYCTRCGKQVIGPVVAGDGRVARHRHLLGILWIAYSSLSLIGGVALLAVVNAIFVHWGAAGRGGPPMLVRPLLLMLALFLLAKGAIGVIGGVGLLQRASWGRILGIVLGCISLINIPFGTALGIYTLWVLLSPNAEADYRALAASAG